MAIQYLNKDFQQLQQALVDYIKNNYQNYSDFGPSSPGNMFIDLSAYVGDVLSFYTDTQVQETLLLEAKERKNILPIAYSLGYSPKLFFGDGYKGLPSFAPFDKIIVTAGAPFMPEALKEQLKIGGTLIIPVGDGKVQQMYSLLKTAENSFATKEHGDFKFVPLLEQKAQ